MGDGHSQNKQAPGRLAPGFSAHLPGSPATRRGPRLGPRIRFPSAASGPRPRRARGHPPPFRGAPSSLLLPPGQASLVYETNLCLAFDFLVCACKLHKMWATNVSAMQTAELGEAALTRAAREQQSTPFLGWLVPFLAGSGRAEREVHSPEPEPSWAVAEEEEGSFLSPRGLTSCKAVFRLPQAEQVSSRTSS